MLFMILIESTSSASSGINDNKFFLKKKKFKSQITNHAELLNYLEG